jgi:hypothetical protein
MFLSFYIITLTLLSASNINKIHTYFFKYQNVSYMLFTLTSTSSTFKLTIVILIYGQYFYLLLCSGTTRLPRNFPSLQMRNIIYVEKEIEVRENLFLKNNFLCTKYQWWTRGGDFGSYNSLGHITYRNSPVDQKLHLCTATPINANHQHTNTTWSTSSLTPRVWQFRFQTVNTIRTHCFTRSLQSAPPISVAQVAMFKTSAI